MNTRITTRRILLMATWLGLLAVAFLVWRFAVVPGQSAVPSSVAERLNTDPANSDLVVLTADEVEEFGIDIRTAGPGTMSLQKSLPGEIRANEDRYAHVTPRVSGVVRSVSANVGSYVRAGEIMAVIESRELADLKAEYLAAVERQELARASFEREERLYKQEITAEADFLEARQANAEAQIRTRSARQKLIALGFSDAYIEALPLEEERSLVAYPLTAPISGSVIEKHVVFGEAVEAATEAFEVADLSTVWADLSIYQRDLGTVQEGQDVIIDAGPGQPRTRGTISYVRPIVGEETRTAIARTVVSNPEGRLKPGQFVTGLLTVRAVEVDVLIPATALIDVEGRTVVFVQTVDGFVPRPVETGDVAGDRVAVLEGLKPGERYVASGAFALKAELGKSELEGGHAH
ncbi:MAG: efflux RND transporter periplasmic adaptor subunit [Rhodothermales bacterium]